MVNTVSGGAPPQLTERNGCLSESRYGPMIHTQRRGSNGAEEERKSEEENRRQGEETHMLCNHAHKELITFYFCMCALSPVDDTISSILVGELSSQVLEV